MPAVFSDPLFVPNMANAMYEVLKPQVPPKASPFDGGSGISSTSSQSEDGGQELEEDVPSTSGTSQQVLEQVTEASDTDSSKTDGLTPEKESPPQGLKVKTPLKHRKHGSKAMSGSSKDGATPSKRRKEQEADDSEATASTRPFEAALQAARFKLYDRNLPAVKEVHAKILRLPKGRSGLFA